jgi:2-dehydropantoate 2-reductase
MLDDTERMKPYKTSMLLDFESGRPLELEAMYERTIQAAASAGVVVPRITRLWTELANRT